MEDRDLGNLRADGRYGCRQSMKINAWWRSEIWHLSEALLYRFDPRLRSGKARIRWPVFETNSSLHVAVGSAQLQGSS